MKKRNYKSPKLQYLLTNAETLRRLYIIEKKTTREIGELFGMSKHPVEIAMEILGIPRRQTRTKGQKPNKEFLQKALLNDCRSLADVARELHCDYGSIKYWAKQYGIHIPKFNGWTQRNAQRGYVRPPKEALENLYNEGYSLSDIGAFFGVTKLPIKEAFDFYGIDVKPSGWGHKSIVCLDGHKVRSTYESRVDDWFYEHGIEHVYEPCVPFDRHSRADFFATGYFIEIFGVMDADWYEKRKQYKIEQYKAHNLPFIAINHWDFATQKKDRWIRKLQVLQNRKDKQ